MGISAKLLRFSYFENCQKFKNLFVFHFLNDDKMFLKNIYLYFLSD